MAWKWGARVDGLISVAVAQEVRTEADWRSSWKSPGMQKLHTYSRFTPLCKAKLLIGSCTTTDLYFCDARAEESCKASSRTPSPSTKLASASRSWAHTLASSYPSQFPLLRWRWCACSPPATLVCNLTHTPSMKYSYTVRNFVVSTCMWFVGTVFSSQHKKCTLNYVPVQLQHSGTWHVLYAHMLHRCCIVSLWHTFTHTHISTHTHASTWTCTWLSSVVFFWSLTRDVYFSGDPYPIRETMIADGVGTVSAIFPSWLVVFRHIWTQSSWHLEHTNIQKPFWALLWNVLEFTLFSAEKETTFWEMYH